jgi:antitoxin component YwqK of YwqJK toxin-antitoxin module
MREIPYINGKENGIVKIYCESGALKQTISYKNDERCETEQMAM